MRFSNWSPISKGRIVSLEGGDTGVISTWHVTNVTWHVSQEGSVLSHWLSLSRQGWIIATRWRYWESPHCHYCTGHLLNKDDDKVEIKQRRKIKVNIELQNTFQILWFLWILCMYIKSVAFFSSNRSSRNANVCLSVMHKIVHSHLSSWLDLLAVFSALLSIPLILQQTDKA